MRENIIDPEILKIIDEHNSELRALAKTILASREIVKEIMIRMHEQNKTIVELINELAEVRKLLEETQKKLS